MKTIVRWSKSSKGREKDEASLLKRLQKLMFDLTEHNTKNIETVVSSLKVVPVKDDGTDTHGDNFLVKIIKPVKVPTWTKSLSLETYTKQIDTWSQINKDVPENTRYQDLIESLKTNKEVKDLPKFVSEHVLTVLKEVDDQTTKRVLDILKIKYRRSRMEKVEECVKNCLNF